MPSYTLGAGRLSEVEGRWAQMGFSHLPPRFEWENGLILCHLVFREVEFLTEADL